MIPFTEEFLYVPVGVGPKDLTSAPLPGSKAYIMTSYQYRPDGVDKCLTLDFIQYQVRKTYKTVNR